jgi:hypothetical protein
MEVLKDTVYLMFGPQAQQEDFGEYAMRIDPDFGVFWRYIKALSTHTQAARELWTGEECRVLILLGMFFLANY